MNSGIVVPPHLSPFITRRVSADSVKLEQAESVPCMGCEESQKIAAQWERRKSTLQPVADPYQEDEEKTMRRVVQLVQQFCTGQRLMQGLKDAIFSCFPILGWAPKLTKAKIRADLIAGATVGVMIIPQSMSYAAIAGLDYKIGMYSATFPLVIYAFMGTSRQLAVGPVAMVSLLVEVGLSGILTEEECPEYFRQGNKSDPLYVPSGETDWIAQSELCPEAYSALAFMTSFVVGLIQIGGALLRLGFLVSFLAHPVISGFTSGAAIVIGLSQVKYFLGYNVPKSQYVYKTLEYIFEKIHELQWEQLILGLSWWFMLSMSRRIATKYKRFGWLRPSAPLIVCVLAIILSACLPLFNGCGFVRCQGNATNKLIVGEIAPGLDGIASVGRLKLSTMGRVLSTAISVSIIGYMESIAIAKSLAAKHKYEVAPSQELLAIGVSNLVGSLMSAYPITGSFSRSAVNNMVGAQTQFSGFVTGILMLFTLLLLTPLVYFLPKYCLAAIVIASVTNLVDYKEAHHLWKVKKADCLLWFIAFLGTLFLGVQIGLIVSVSCSLALVVIESIRPQISVLWKLPGTAIYRNIKQESYGQFVYGVLIVRIGSSMYFANVAYIRDYILKMIKEFSTEFNPV